MIIRDVHGKLCIVNRKDCKNDASYYEKLYEISGGFAKAGLDKSKEGLSSNHFSNDIEHEDEDE